MATPEAKAIYSDASSDRRISQRLAERQIEVGAATCRGLIKARAEALVGVPDLQPAALL
jgi:hypothetical protein